MDGESSNFSRLNFRGWPALDCSAHICPASRRMELVKQLVNVPQRETARESHTIEAMVRGYHVYKEIWLATLGEELSCTREVENHRDPFAVAVVKSEVVVGHLPRKISSICSMFLRRGGTIDCRVTGGRRFSEDLPQGGLEIRCTLTLRGSHSDINKVKGLLKRAFSSNDSAEKRKRATQKEAQTYLA